jgi:membrane associated rhomboid family serine protease
MANGRCDQCGVEEYMPYLCKFCKGRYCAAHRLPENHNCAGLGAYRERVRDGGRILQSDPLVRPVKATRAARAGASLDALWSRLDGKMTYVFLGIIVAFYLAEWIVAFGLGADAFEAIFVIDRNVLAHPWTIVTNIFSHSLGSIGHIAVNGLVLLFFGQTVERLIGTRRYTLLFLGAGIVAGLAQVVLANALFGSFCGGSPAGCGAYGASGALQGLMGTLVVLAPTLTVLVFFVIPAPLWALTIFYVLFDVFFNTTPGSGVGGFAHLSGLAVGLAYGYYLRQRGLRAVVRPREPTLRGF